MDMPLGSIILAFLPQIVVGLFGLAVTMWAKAKQNWSWPIATISLIGVTAALLFIYNNIPIEWPLKSSRIEYNLRNWADEGGYSIKSSLEKGDRFRFILDNDTSVKVTVVNREKDSPLIIFLGVGIRLPQNAEKLLTNLGEKRRQKFIEKLKIELLRLGPQYKINYFKSTNQIENIYLFTVFFYSDLNAKAEFIDKLGLTIRTTKIVEALFSEEALNTI